MRSGKRRYPFGKSWSPLPFFRNSSQKIYKSSVSLRDLDPHSVLYRWDGGLLRSSDNPFKRRDTVVRHNKLDINMIIRRAAPVGSYEKTIFREVTRYARITLIVDNEFRCKPSDESWMSSLVHCSRLSLMDLSRYLQHVYQSSQCDKTL